MARPRKSGGKSTSFGKRSEAEKSFRDRKKRSGRGAKEETSQPRFKRSGANEFRASRPNRFGGKPSFSRRDEKGESTDRPFRKSSQGSFSSRGAGGFRKKTSQDEGTRFEKKPFQRREKDTGYQKTSRFGNKPYSKRTEGDEKPFNKRRSASFRSEEERTPFSKKPFIRKDAGEDEKRSFRKKEGGEKSFGKSGHYGLPYKRKPIVKRGFKSTKPVREEAKPKTDSDLIRLNKFMANSGVGSRREADELIRMGLVTVNGETITEMGYKVKPSDDVRYEGRKLKAEKPVYILLNKPKGFITTTDDPQERNTVMNLVATAGKERIYPVGRLDRNTTGLLLLTNDGDLADKLTHPSYNVKKIYRVELDKPITKNDFIKIKEGVYLEEGKAVVDDLAIVDGDNKTLGIELHIGWNRIVRRIFESLGYQVVKLDRVAYAGLDKKDLARGQWRFLKPEEVVMLKHFK